MTLNELSEHCHKTIENIKNHGIFPKENDLVDYKKELNFHGLSDEVEIFLRNFAKDILSFSNGKGGIILIGFYEEKTTGKIDDIGLNQSNLELLRKIDLNIINQKIDSITKCNIGIDLQGFQTGTRKFYYLLIEKQSQVIIPLNNYPDYKLRKGEIIHRIPGKNETANENTQKLNSFLQVKANEKNKEFMEIWSKLLPEIFDINPREILMINPKTNRIYGYNAKDKNLSSSEIDIDKNENGAFNIILNAISAGEIGKISDNEGKPLYKIVGEIKTLAHRDYISFSTLEAEVRKDAEYNFSNPLLKLALKYLNWTNVENFHVDNPKDDVLNSEYSDFIWIENVDTIKNKKKVVFAKDAIKIIVDTINDKVNHKKIFKKELNLKQK